MDITTDNSDLLENSDVIFTVNGNSFIVRAIFLSDSVFLWICRSDDSHKLGNLAVSMPTKYSPMPLSSQLISDGTQDDRAAEIGVRIAKKFKLQVFISVNIGGDYDTSAMGIEKVLVDMLSERYTRST